MCPMYRYVLYVQRSLFKRFCIAPRVRALTTVVHLLLWLQSCFCCHVQYHIPLTDKGTLERSTTLHTSCSRAGHTGAFVLDA